MATYFEKIYDIATGQETIRPYTTEEIAQSQAEESRLLDEQDKRNADQAAKIAAKQAVLDKLGLSADEVAALLA